MSATAEPAGRPCIDCGEPTLNDERCRDCDIEYIVDLSTCKACGFVQIDLTPLGFAPVGRSHFDVDACPWMAL